MRQHGFTIIELTVIVVTIGILATMSVFGYGSWRLRTAENEVKSGLDHLRASMDDARNFDNIYPATIPDGFTNGAETGVSVTTHKTVEFRIVTAADGLSYCGRARSTVSTIAYYIKPPTITAPTTALPSGCSFP